MHQQIGVENHYGAQSAPRVRLIRERSGRGLIVFHGHSHQNGCRQLGGIHYGPLRAIFDQHVLDAKASFA